jgi:anti-sigma B factor antagonist
MGVTRHAPIDGGWDQWGKAAFRVGSAGGFVVVAAHGEVDLDTAAGLDQAVRTALRSCPHLVVDLTQVSFIDSSGLGVLVGARRMATALGGEVSLVHPPALVQRILAGTGLRQSFPVYSSLDEAMRAGPAA